jgi:hypothetical protein
MGLAEGTLSGTSLDVPRLVSRAGGIDGLAAHLLGRAPDVAERAVLLRSASPLGVVLASPSFQRC